MQELLEKVSYLQHGAEFVVGIDISESKNIEFDKKRIEMARGKAIAYGYVKSLIEGMEKTK